MQNSTPQFLKWARRLQAIAQSGLAYCTNMYDIQRFHEVEDIAAEILAEGSDTSLEQIKELFSAQSGYATPKLDCRGVVFQDEKILLVRELSDGGWTLPGGWVDVGEPLSLAVEREVHEEAGWLVHADRLLAVYDRDLHGHPPYPFHSYKLFVLCEILSKGEAEPTETADATFFAENAIPSLSLLRTTPEEITRLFHLYHHPELPTDFD